MSPKIMGIVNVTPDSFSDGGDFFTPNCALRHAQKLLSDGADFIDLGAESTRPRAKRVDSETEWARLLPVLELLEGEQLNQKVSLDTRNEDTAVRASEQFSIAWINNVSGLFSANTLKRLSRSTQLGYIGMHMHKDPSHMQDDPLDGDQALSSVESSLRDYKETLINCGFTNERIFLDPGIGFGKNDQANLKLIGALGRFSQIGKIMIGVSRKSMFERLLGIKTPKDRDHASKILELACMYLGVGMIRTHEVANLVKIRSLLA